MTHPFTLVRLLALCCEEASSSVSTYANAGGLCARPDVKPNALSVIVE